MPRNDCERAGHGSGIAASVGVSAPVAVVIGPLARSVGPGCRRRPAGRAVQPSGHVGTTPAAERHRGAPCGRITPLPAPRAAEQDPVLDRLGVASVEVHGLPARRVEDVPVATGSPRHRGPPSARATATSDTGHMLAPVPVPATSPAGHQDRAQGARTTAPGPVSRPPVRRVGHGACGGLAGAVGHGHRDVDLERFRRRTWG